MKNRIETLLAGREPALTLLREIDQAVIAAAEKHAQHDEDHQTIVLSYLTILDEAFGVFQDHPAMQKAYTQLAGASARVFWNAGLPKFKEYRAKAWDKLLR